MNDINATTRRLLAVHASAQTHVTGYPILAADPDDILTIATFAQTAIALLDCTEFELDWLTLHHVIEKEGADWRSKFDGSTFFQCDCSESGGYMEYDTNAYIHTERCASGHEDSLAALHDQVKQALGRG